MIAILYNTVFTIKITTANRIFYYVPKHIVNSGL